MKNKIVFIIVFLFFSSKVFGLYLGDGTDDYQKKPIYIMNDVIDVYSDGQTTLFLKSDHSLWGCGDNAAGQLGTADKNKFNYPIKIADNVDSFCTSSGSVIYNTFDGKLFILGLVPYEMLSNNRISFIESSDPVFFAENAFKCFVYKKSFFYISKNMDLYTFGNNNRGQLCDGTRTSRITPQRTLQNIREITIADYDNILLLDTVGNVFQCSESPKNIISNIKKIKGNFVLTEKDELYVKGNNLYGSLGLELGKYYNEYVYLMSNVIDMDSNQDHSLIINSDNELFVCGGGNKNERRKATGDGEVHYVPYPLKEMKNGKKVFVAGICSFIITSNNELWAFGANSQDDYSGL